MKEINNNIQESYVSYEVGKLLKNKGFNWIYDEFNPDYNGEHSYFQNINNTSEIKMFSHYYIENNHNGLRWLYLNIPAPTHAIAIEWLLVNFEIFICVVCDIGHDDIYTFKLYLVKCGYEKCITNSSLRYNTPQEATEVALKYVLEELL